MRPRCPKCGSAPSYEEGGYHVCMMGGHRWPVNGAKPIIVHKRMEEESMEGTKPTSGKKGTCVNCEREKFIADKEGLCSTCHNAVAGISKDSVAYTAALADVKKRLINNPSRRGKVAKAKAMAAAPVKRAKRDINPARVEASDRRPQDTDVIESLVLWQEWHEDQAKKYKQAIVLLS
jgi:hypothetical protein